MLKVYGLARKWYPYHESIRVPLIVYDPRMPADKVGTIDDSFTLNVDLAETILGAAGIKPHERMSDLYIPKKDDKGRTSLERNPWRDEFFYKFTFMDEKFIPLSNALVRKKWKFIDWYNYNETQLFNLDDDPMELYDVKDKPEYRNVYNEMKEKLATLKAEMTEPSGPGCHRGLDYSILGARELPKE